MSIYQLGANCNTTRELYDVDVTLQLNKKAKTDEQINESKQRTKKLDYIYVHLDSWHTPGKIISQLNTLGYHEYTSHP